MLLGGKSYAFAEYQQIFVTLTDFTLERERYCLPDSRFVLVYKSRDFVPGYSRFARYCLPDRACGLVVLVVLLFGLSCCLVVLLTCCFVG